jgi:hypothetical protein
LNLFEYLYFTYKIDGNKLKGILFTLFISYISNTEVVYSKEIFMKFKKILQENKENNNSFKNDFVGVIEELSEILKGDINDFNVKDFLNQKILIEINSKENSDLDIDLDLINFFDLRKIKNKEECLENLFNLYKDF